MRKFALIAVVALIALSTTGCLTQTHTIGSGPHAQQTEEYHQYYTLFGFVPISDEKDGGKIAGTTKCRITTTSKPLDCAITFFAGMGLFLSRRTIVIEK